MDFFLLAFFVAIGIYFLNAKEHKRRVLLLGSHLSQFQIEKLMETLTQGYLRALGEKDLERRDQIWNLLATTEVQLCDQYARFAADFAKVDAEQTRVSTLPVAIPYADKWLPNASFDARKAFAVHARGMALTVQNNAQLSPRDKAFTMSAELFLMQHTCHWFCKSKNVASARMMLRHQTAYQQLVDAVTPATREAYSKLIAG